MIERGRREGGEGRTYHVLLTDNICRINPTEKRRNEELEGREGEEREGGARNEREERGVKGEQRRGEERVAVPHSTIANASSRWGPHGYLCGSTPNEEDDAGAAQPFGIHTRITTPKHK